MRVFEMGRLAPPAVAALHALVLGAVLWLVASQITQSKHILHLYRYSLGSIPAYLYMDRLSRTLEDGPNQVLLVGPSTVREGFDDALMSRTAPGFTFINTGVTSPGTMPHTELLVDIIRWYGIEVDQIILGLNSRMLASRYSPIAQTRYVDLMDYRDGLYYLNFETPMTVSAALNELDHNRFWPMRRIAIRLDYLARFWMFKLRSRFSWKAPLPRHAFERSADRLEHHAGFLYDDQRHRPDLFRKHLQSMARLGLMDPGRYGREPQVQSMRRTLTKARQIARRVTVVIMPEHSLVRSAFGAFADDPFLGLLREFEAKGVRVIDRRGSIPDQLIRDIAHLVPEGREILSRDVAAAAAM